MKMNMKQTKLVGLTMRLEEKTLQYKQLCQKLDDLKAKNIDENSLELVELADAFLKNQNEIKSILNELELLKDAD